MQPCALEGAWLLLTVREQRFGTQCIAALSKYMHALPSSHALYTCAAQIAWRLGHSIDCLLLV